MDLTTLENVKDYCKVQGSVDDDLIQDAITSFSRHVLNVTGIQSFAVAQYTENRDGNGNSRLFVRNPPIVNVSAVILNGVAVPQSTSFSAPGFFISDDAKYIALRSAGASKSAYPAIRYRLTNLVFDRGVGNLQITYYGGYATLPEDLEFAVRQCVAINYRRTGTIDQASKSLSTQAGTGTTRYRDWAVPPEAECVFEHYSRQALI